MHFEQKFQIVGCYVFVAILIPVCIWLFIDAESGGGRLTAAAFMIALLIFLVWFLRADKSKFFVPTEDYVYKLMMKELFGQDVKDLLKDYPTKLPPSVELIQLERVHNDGGSWFIDVYTPEAMAKANRNAKDPQKLTKKNPLFGHNVSRKFDKIEPL